MKLNERLKLLRILGGYSQEELAERCQIAQQKLTAYERGAYTPKSEAILSLADVLGVSPNYLVFGQPRVSGQTWIIPQPRAQGEKRLSRDLDKLFPLFLAENGLNSAIARRVVDGGYFLLGNEKNFDILLIAPASIYEQILSMAKGKDLHELADASSLTVSEIGVDEINFLKKYRELYNWNFDSDGLTKTLHNKRLLTNTKPLSGAEIVIPKKSLEKIFICFLAEAQGLNVENYGTALGDFFIQKCEELCHRTPQNILIFKLREEVRDHLKNALSCLPPSP